MINSLCKDSHITQSLSHSQKLKNAEVYSRGSKRKEHHSATVTKNIGINVNKPAEPSFCGLVSSIKNFDIYKNEHVKKILRLVSSIKNFDIYKNEHVKNILRSDHVKKILKFAYTYQPIFSAGFAMLLTCLLRPATIMALPSEKKNIDDKKYAAAQSISSGIIGFVFSLAITKPIGDAIKRTLNNPGEYITKNLTKFKTENKGNLSGVANNYLNQTTEIITALPKATFTIALVPIILKYVFGLSKKKDGNDYIGQNFTALNFKSAMHNKNVFQQFTGGKQ